MNFLEIINKCLLELNYKPVNALSELVKNDHKKIKNIINIVNQEVCNIENWNFLLRRKSLTIPAGETEIDNTVKGRILYLFVENKVYKFVPEVDSFLMGKAKECTYSVIDNKLLYPKADKNRTVNVIYYTNNCVVDENNAEKLLFEDATDESLIPMPFAEQLLIYGTCLRLKANPQYIRFNYWMSMYKQALSNLKSRTSVYSKDAPIVRLHRD